MNKAKNCLLTQCAKFTTMRKIIFFLTLLPFVIKSFSQPQALTKDYYLKKSKTQKAVAWILLSGGTALAVGGAISFVHNDLYGSNSATDISGFVMLGGVVSDIVSIPFFLSSAKNKRGSCCACGQ